MLTVIKRLLAKEGQAEEFFTGIPKQKDMVFLSCLNLLAEIHNMEGNRSKFCFG